MARTLNTETLPKSHTAHPRPTGRPTIYSLELAERICSLLASHFKSLRWICLQPDMPARTTVYTWLEEIPEFQRLYRIARDEQLEQLADEMIEFANGDGHDWIKDQDGNMIPNRQAIARNKLQIAVRQWLITHLFPKKYLGVTESEPEPEPVGLTLEEFRQRMIDARA